MGYLHNPTEISENCPHTTSESVVRQKIGLILSVKNELYDTACQIVKICLYGLNWFLVIIGLDEKKIDA
jgi:hypothetical protein